MGLILRGIWSGFFATSTMTMVMVRLYQWFPRARRAPLPPATLTKSLLKKVGVEKNLSKNTQIETTMLSHSAFGSFCGVIYAAIAPRIKGNSLLKGSLFGAGVWATSYMGWIPALKLQPQSRHLNRQQNTMMFLAHLVWGASLGYMEQEFRRSGKKMLAHRSANPLAQITH